MIKVQKPGVKEQVTVDGEILRHMVESVAHHSKGVQEYDLDGLVEEIADTDERGTRLHPGRPQRGIFCPVFNDDATIHIPKIYRNYTTSRVITLKHIHGINILDIPALDKAKFDLQELAK
jgi:ubiquinone biosynthesis protein